MLKVLSIWEHIPVYLYIYIYILGVLVGGLSAALALPSLEFNIFQNHETSQPHRSCAQNVEINVQDCCFAVGGGV
jgi:hypothetical protein